MSDFTPDWDAIDTQDEDAPNDPVFAPAALLGANVRNGRDAEAWGRRQIKSPSRSWFNLCLMFVRMCFNVPARYSMAGLAWDNAKIRHRTRNYSEVPKFVPYFYETPGAADHIVFTLGGGMCLSNDFVRKGKIDVTSMKALERWGTPLGWTEDLNGVRVWEAAKPKPKPKPPPSRGSQIEAADDALESAARHLGKTRRPSQQARIAEATKQTQAARSALKQIPTL